MLLDRRISDFWLKNLRFLPQKRPNNVFLGEKKWLFWVPWIGMGPYQLFFLSSSAMKQNLKHRNEGRQADFRFMVNKTAVLFFT